MSAYRTKESARRILTASFGAILVAMTAAALTTAQNVLPSKLDLNTAVERALETDPQIKVSDSRTKIADLKINEARAGRQPFAQFSQSVVRSNNPVFVFGSLLEQGRFGASNFAINSLNNPNGLFNFRTLASVQMPIFDQRQTGSRITQAEIAKKQTALQAESVRQQLRFDVLRTFYGVVLGREMVMANNEAVR